MAQIGNLTKCGVPPRDSRKQAKPGRRAVFGLIKRHHAANRRHELQLALASADDARDRKDWSKARAAYEQVLALDGSRGDLWVQLGHCLKEQELLSAAKDAYGHALATSAKGDALLHLGHVAKMEGRFSEALSYYRQSADLTGEGSDAAHEIRSVSRWNREKPGPGSSNDDPVGSNNEFAGPSCNINEIDRYSLLTLLAHRIGYMRLTGQQAQRIEKRRAGLLKRLKLFPDDEKS